MAAVPVGPPSATTPANVQSSRDPANPRKAINDILKLKSNPTYYNVRKAWGILGFSTKATKPDTQNLLNQVNALWQAIAAIDTRRSRRARAIMIDALRSLGYRSPLWKASSKTLDVANLPAILPWPPAQNPGWGSNNATHYLGQHAPSTIQFEHWANRQAEKGVWQDYHRYQGFAISGIHGPGPAAPDTKIFLRAIPVPKDSDSLWRSVSYWALRRQTNSPTANHGPDVTRHWAVKMQIWAYFMQVLKDGDHPRWCEYHMLQKASKTDHPEFGKLSLARSLYASGRQGLPAYPHEYILFVIADFFGMQVIVFRVPDPQDGQSETIKLHHRQDKTNYEVRVYGEPSVNNKRQILLAADKTHRYYDPVDFDYGPLHEKSGWSAGRDGTATPAPPGVAPPFTIRVNAGAGDFCAPRGPCTWWPGETHRAAAGGPFQNWNARNLKATWPALSTTPDAHCPNDLARYNYIPPDDRTYIDAAIDSVPSTRNEDGPHRIYDGTERDLYGPLPHRFIATAGNDKYGDCILTDDVFKCFRAGIDIPGIGFAAPLDDVIDGWTTARGPGNVDPPGAAPANDSAYDPVDAVPEFEWRFGHKPASIDKVDGYLLLDDPYLEFEDDKDMVKG
ncbi:hypothetical protein QBC44DRAFT_332356 [Cladorrhinum sp. PSN332]|nr:hypothetical protein QBC44DRAFT_332356 [Cladorrhinum sp. PSN332]